VTVDVRRILREKRNGRAHTPEDVAALIAGYVGGEVPDYQVSAWLMAAFLRGLDETETDALTRALIRSGRTFDWSDLGRPSADKHSTGGVGDKISLILAPLVAACGVLVPMVSGRGLGHTGGTLDKLESIPGFRTHLSPEAMRSQLDALGVVMVGQGADLTPADGKLYALRDVTSTVENESFIVSSIVSKKFAEGADAIVYDVKCGNGAFMKNAESARRLARRLVSTTRSLGRKAAALVTDMSQPLGEAVGNALEVRESVDVLRGGGPEDVRVLTLELAASMLQGCGAEADRASALARAQRALESGAAWEKFLGMVAAQGGDAALVGRPDGMARAPVVHDAKAERAGTIEAIDSFGLGELVVKIGGGRASKEDRIDPRVGLMIRRRLGDTVEAGAVLAEVHLAAEDRSAVEWAARCFQVGSTAPTVPSLILERVE
jgi:pyrimidine-nucleoside phosphorylase/thymidine phosphorylase